MMVHRHTCDDCDNYVDYLDRGGSLACGECGGDLSFESTVGVVSGISESDSHE